MFNPFPPLSLFIYKKEKWISSDLLSVNSIWCCCTKSTRCSVHCMMKDKTVYQVDSRWGNYHDHTADGGCQHIQTHNWTFLQHNTLENMANRCVIIEAYYYTGMCELFVHCRKKDRKYRWLGRSWHLNCHFIFITLCCFVWEHLNTFSRGRV